MALRAALPKKAAPDSPAALGSFGPAAPTAVAAAAAAAARRAAMPGPPTAAGRREEEAPGPTEGALATCKRAPSGCSSASRALAAISLRQFTRPSFNSARVGLRCNGSLASEGLIVQVRTVCFCNSSTSKSGSSRVPFTSTMLSPVLTRRPLPEAFHSATRPSPMAKISRAGSPECQRLTSMPSFSLRVRSRTTSYLPSSCSSCKCLRHAIWRSGTWVTPPARA
mmetsp:Transcript_146265/g.380144  ORF Transcript_146265/g.380144 Transcript_146265/m.380144 type:complete len:224 (-) Transcript_146265:7-678(-)